MNQEELAAAVRENEGRIRAYIARMIGDPDEAADLAQETFARAEKGRDAFRGESKISTWLYSIATRVSLDFLKSAGRRRLQVTAPESLDETPAGEEDGPRLTAALLFDQAEMGECVRRYIDELPPDQRMALLLHDIEGMTNPEAAEALNCTVGAVKIRLHRARGKLRSVLQEKCTFGRDERGVFVCEPKPSEEKPSAWPFFVPER
ncbi:MAG: RNA polymerase sigma factor, partial [bacterium]